MNIRVGIFGATGYTGVELTRLLHAHPAAEVVFATSHSFAGQPLDEIAPSAPPYPLVGHEAAPLAEAEVVFLCLPHAASAATAVRALRAGCKVIDLSADFRLAEATTYERWYKSAHPAPHLLQTAVYGLTEQARPQLRGAELVACPGCYPTSILLPLAPLLAAGAIAPDQPLIADAKSGVSGAGRTPQPHTHFVAVTDNMTPYKLGQSHRHWAEMHQMLARWGNGSAPSLLFSPHLMAIPRGILSTIYVPLAKGWDEVRLRHLYAVVYGDEPFIKLLPAGQPATIAHVVRTNRCAIGLHLAAERTAIITSAIDNLLKGAAGQAVQNFNVVMGLPETTGLS